MLVLNLKLMIMEGELKLAPKEASNYYQSSHFYSYVFWKPSSGLPSSLRKIFNIKMKGATELE